MSMHDHITQRQVELIRTSRIFFVASVDPAFSGGPAGEGPVNLSPKGATRLHVIDAHRVAYLDFHGSGNETARHAAGGGPVTVMIMSVDAEDAGIVRLYGHATATPIEASPLAGRLLAGGAEHLENERQIIEIRVERTQTSCGYGVPVLAYVGERTQAQRGGRYKEMRHQAP